MDHRLTLQSSRSGRRLKQTLHAAAPCCRDTLPVPKHSTHRMLCSSPGKRANSKEKLGGVKHGMKGGYPKEQPEVKSKAKSTRKSPLLLLSFSLGSSVQGDECKKLSAPAEAASNASIGKAGRVVLQLAPGQRPWCSWTQSNVWALSQSKPSSKTSLLDSTCWGGGTCPGHKQAKGVSKTSDDLQPRVEPQDYPIPPPKPLQTPMAPCSAEC